MDTARGTSPIATKKMQSNILSTIFAKSIIILMLKNMPCTTDRWEWLPTQSVFHRQTDGIQPCQAGRFLE